jgi:biopolymer transport protein TolR
MAFAFSSQGKVSSEINVTPMIDVLLVLLIIFMVIHPVAKLGETADIPHPGKQDINVLHPRTIVIGLHDAGEGKAPTIEINKEQIGWNDLQGRLQNIYKFREEKVAFLHSDPEVEFQFVADVVDMTHFAGIDHVGFVANKD